MLKRPERIGPPKWPVNEGRRQMVLARVYVLHQRDCLMRAAANRMNSHRRRLEFGLQGNLSAEEIQVLWDYMDALRDITRQPGFPFTVNFPKAPQSLRGDVIE